MATPAMTPASKLTRRETEIVLLRCAGYTSQEVSDKLFVSKRTTDFHIGNIYKKLSVRNAIELAIWADKAGILPRAEHVIRREITVQ